MPKYISALLILTGLLPVSAYAVEPIQHDAEHYILLNQHADQWAAEDKSIDKVLADQRASNNGKPPNIIYILAAIKQVSLWTARGLPKDPSVFLSQAALSWLVKVMLKSDITLGLTHLVSMYTLVNIMSHTPFH